MDENRIDDHREDISVLYLRGKFENKNSLLLSVPFHLLSVSLYILCVFFSSYLFRTFDPKIDLHIYRCSHDVIFIAVSDCVDIDVASLFSSSDLRFHW